MSVPTCPQVYRAINRITAALKAYFPQVLDWFRDKEAAVFADFIERWPTLDLAQRASTGADPGEPRIAGIVVRAG